MSLSKPAVSSGGNKRQILCFNQERIRKAEEFLESPQQTAWNPAWKRNKKKKNKRKHH
jgi:hypothetical protein